ncbi:hypothetical protein GCM10008119_36910 [Pedobacter mendelii]|uniref:Glycosyl transferase family 1 domain-containing protein n=2 Tax=Pedobacter mendelii TaxID=1908240 RepID=A0ABQ2BPB7_9SPHI|nr:hypothetical protein GCM10008119_36910 [Pedobacter mendelii]
MHKQQEMRKTNTKKNICIISSCSEDWGGSEELWGKTVPYLIEEGLKITVYKTFVNQQHPEFKKLASLGVKFENIDIVKPFLVRNANKIIDKFTQLSGDSEPFSFYNNPWVNNLIKSFKKNKPDFAIISQGINFDGLSYAYACNKLAIPYVLIVQKAVDFYWPAGGDRPQMTRLLKEAKACYFVSKHNLNLTEEQFGTRLENSKVIFNPQKIGNIHPFPPITGEVKLACVGRLFLLDKGQDILIRILSRKRWQDRNLSVTFIGKGNDENGLKDLASLLNVKKIVFKGQVEDIDSLWKDFHALVLPSRSEGLPLSMVEAMAAGRPVIVSKSGGNTELIEENVTGFSGLPFEDTFEEAMERAYRRLDEWKEIGKKAAAYIAKSVPKKPEKDFAAEIISLIKTS